MHGWLSSLSLSLSLFGDEASGIKSLTLMPAPSLFAQSLPAREEGSLACLSRRFFWRASFAPIPDEISFTKRGISLWVYRSGGRRCPMTCHYGGGSNSRTTKGGDRGGIRSGRKTKAPAIFRPQNHGDAFKKWGATTTTTTIVGSRERGFIFSILSRYRGRLSLSHPA